MKNIQQRINNAVGQLNGVSHMIQKNRDCLDILTQMKAARSSIESAMEKYAEENFLGCLGSCGKQDREKIKKLLVELTKK